MTEAFSALAPAAFGGRRRGASVKKLKLVKKKTVRRMLKKLGMKMAKRGGGAAAAGTGSVALDAPVADAVKDVADAPTGGRRRRGRSGKATRRRKFLGVF